MTTIIEGRDSDYADKQEQLRKKFKRTQKRIKRAKSLEKNFKKREAEWMARTAKITEQAQVKLQKAKSKHNKLVKQVKASMQAVEDIRGTTSKRVKLLQRENKELSDKVDALKKDTQSCLSTATKLEKKLESSVMDGESCEAEAKKAIKGLALATKVNKKAKNAALRAREEAKKAKEEAKKAKKLAMKHKKSAGETKDKAKDVMKRMLGHIEVHYKNEEERFKLEEQDLKRQIEDELDQIKLLEKVIEVMKTRLIGYGESNKEITSEIAEQMTGHGAQMKAATLKQSKPVHIGGKDFDDLNDKDLMEILEDTGGNGVSKDSKKERKSSSIHGAHIPKVSTKLPKPEKIIAPSVDTSLPQPNLDHIHVKPRSVTVSSPGHYDFAKPDSTKLKLETSKMKNAANKAKSTILASSESSKTSAADASKDRNERKFEQAMNAAKAELHKAAEGSSILKAAPFLSDHSKSSSSSPVKPAASTPHLSKLDLKSPSKSVDLHSQASSLTSAINTPSKSADLSSSISSLSSSSIKMPSTSADLPAATSSLTSAINTPSKSADLSSSTSSLSSSIKMPSTSADLSAATSSLSSSIKTPSKPVDLGSATSMLIKSLKSSTDSTSALSSDKDRAPAKSKVLASSSLSSSAASNPTSFLDKLPSSLKAKPIDIGQIAHTPSSPLLSKSTSSITSPLTKASSSTGNHASVSEKEQINEARNMLRAEAGIPPLKKT